MLLDKDTLSDKTSKNSEDESMNNRMIELKSELIGNGLELLAQGAYIKKLQKNGICSKALIELFEQNYQKILFVHKKGIPFFTDHQKSELILYPVFENSSIKLSRFEGKLLNKKNSGSYDQMYSSATVVLEPCWAKSKIIPLFKGTVSWPGRNDYISKPVCVRPVYGWPSAKLIALDPVMEIGDSWIFKDAKIEYTNLEIRVEDAE